MQLKMSSRLQTVINLTTGIFTMLVSLVINFFLSSYIVAELGEEANGFTVGEQLRYIRLAVDACV